MKILVTGCAGYIGSSLVPRLLKSGYRVVGIDNCKRSKIPTLNHVISHPQFTFVKHDVCEGIPSEIMREVDVIIPLAALVGLKLCEANKHEAWNVNQLAIYDMVHSMNGEQLLIFPNTNSGYGQTTGDELCTESTPMNPISEYGKSKASAEEIVLAYGNSVVFRLATVFGVAPRMRLDLLVNDWAYQACFWKYLKIFEPNYVRNYVHIDDVVDAFLYTLSHHRRMRGQVYNLGYDQGNMSKMALAEKICEYFPCHIDIINGKDPDQRNYIVSSGRLTRTGFTAQYGLDLGLQQLKVLFDTFPQDYESLRRMRKYMSNDYL